MEVENKVKKPSLPRNYVSLSQLQERWMEEQQRKKREEEEKKERQRKEKEAEEDDRRRRQEEEAERRRREEERKRRETDEAERSRLGKDSQIGRNRNGYRREYSELSRDQKPSISRRNHYGKSFRTIGIGESKSDEEKDRQRKENEAEEEERRWRQEEEAERRRREKDKVERSRLGQDDQIGRNRNGYLNQKPSRDQNPSIYRRNQSGKSFRATGIEESKSEEEKERQRKEEEEERKWRQEEEAERRRRENERQRKEEEERKWRQEEEAERRRKEKEAEEDRKRREKDEAERNRLGQEIGRNRNGYRRESNELSGGRKSPISRRNQSGTTGIGESKPEESQIGFIYVDDGEKKIEDGNERGKKKKKWNSRKPRADKELLGSTEQKKKKKMKSKRDRKKPRADKELISPETEKVDEHLPAALAKPDGGNQSGKSIITIGVGERSSEESQVRAISVEGVNDRDMKRLNRRKPRADKELSGNTADEHIPAALAKRDNGKEENGNEFHRNGRAAIDVGLEKKVSVQTWIWKEKCRAEENLTIGGKQVLPERKAEKSIPVGVAEQEDEMGTNIGDQRNGKLLVVVNNNVPRKEKQVEVDQSSGIEGKLVDLSLNGETRGFKKNAGAPNRHGYKKKYNGGFGRFSGRRATKSKESDLIWVRKDNASDSKVAEWGTEVSQAGWKAVRKPYR